MHCLSCGKLIDDDSNFCKFCGELQIAELVVLFRVFAQRGEATDFSKPFNLVGEELEGVWEALNLASAIYAPGMQLWVGEYFPESATDKAITCTTLYKLECNAERCDTADVLGPITLSIVTQG